MTRMGPTRGSPEYHEQVKLIVNILELEDAANVTEVDRILMVFITDPSISRAAICEARKKRLLHGWS